MNKARGVDPGRWAVALLILLLVVPRFVALDVRPMMHDESLFGFYAYLFFKTGRYVHQPVLHGPVQMLGIGWFFRLFGDSAGVARAFIACCSLVAMGGSLLLLPARFRLWVAPLLFTSPILLYYSRYLHEEMIFSALVIVGVLGCVHARAPGLGGVTARVVGAAAFALLLAVKENSVFVYATGLTFFAARWLTGRFWPGRAGALVPHAATSGPGDRTGRVRTWIAGLTGGVEDRNAMERADVRRRRRKKKKEPQVTSTDPGDPVPSGAGGGLPPAAVSAANVRPGQDYVIGALTGLAMVLWIYGTTTADFSFSPLSAMKASWEYWLGQHREHRIIGAIDYYLPILVTYELPLIVLLALGLCLDALQRPRRVAWYGGWLLAWPLLWLVWSVLPARGPLQRVADFLHVRPDGAMLLLGCGIAPLLAWSVLCMKEHRPLASWMGWWASCSLFQYSSAGEKVPWLAVHMALPLYLSLGWLWAPLLLRLDRSWSRGLAAVVVVATVLALRNDCFLIGPRACDPRERLVYNHTPVEFDRFCRSTLQGWDRSRAAVPLTGRRVVLAGDPTWPGIWYFRHCAYELADAPLASLDPAVDLVLATPGLAERPVAALDRSRYRSSTLSLRDHWMVGWPPADSLGSWWRYFWYREEWPPAPGSFPITVIEPVQPR